MEVQNIDACQDQRDDLNAKERAFVSFFRLAPEQQDSGDHHDRETGHHPLKDVGLHLRNGFVFHGESQQTQVPPQNGPNGDSKREDMNSFNNREKEDRFANLSSPVRVLETLTDFQKRHIKPSFTPSRNMCRMSTFRPKDINAAIPLNLLKTSLISLNSGRPGRSAASQSWIYRIDRIYSAPATQVRVSEPNKIKGVTVCDSP